MSTNWKEIVSRSAMLVLGAMSLAGGIALFFVVLKYLSDPDIADPEGSGLCSLLGFGLVLAGGYLAFSAFRRPTKDRN